MGRDCGLERILGYLTGGRPAELGKSHSFAAWWKESQKELAPWHLSPDQAIVGGYRALCLGYAFAAGYEAALRSLVPSLISVELACLSVTEEGGGHPRALKTRLEPAPSSSGGKTWLMSGKKRWATLGREAEILFVAASLGTDASGRNEIRLVRVDPKSAGVTVRPMPPSCFAPEIAHAEICLAAVAVAPDDVLAGDGYCDYIKPFRTVEDTHVNAAVFGYLLRIARATDWPRELTGEILSLTVALRALALADPAGLSFWKRDKALLDVATRARAERLESAWRKASGNAC